MKKPTQLPLTVSLCVALLSLAFPAHAGNALSSNGVTSNTTLVANQNIAKAQAAGAITTFMNQGAQTCDSNGKNCHSVFGADDTPDYTTLQQSAQSTVGIQNFSFQGGASGQDSSSISAQTGIFALACGDSGVKNVAGIAVKVTSCVVNTSGDAQVTIRSCSAPSRGNPVSPPKNAVTCSTDPASPNFKAPVGKVCARPACDSEPVDSLNGWSSPQTLTFTANMPSTASADDIAKNGLGLSFYPPLNGGITGTYTTDSDNMTAFKVVQTFVNSATKKTAVGIRIAYRHKAVVTKDMMVKGASSVPDPGSHTAQWDTLTKLQGNALIPQYQAKYGANGSNCLQQLQSGIAKDGVISVCDKNYTNESGIRPGALTAQVAAEGQNCGTTPQCLNTVVNTNTWTQTCSADVPLSLRSCETKTDYTLNELTYTRTRQKEVCHEQRLTAQYSCNTYETIGVCSQVSVVQQGGVDLGANAGDTSVVYMGSSADGLTAYFRLGVIGDNYWGTGYYRRTFTVNITDKSQVKTFTMYHVGYDDEQAIAVNGTWLWVDWPTWGSAASAFDVTQNAWGWWESNSDSDSGQIYTYFMSNYERGVSWQYDTNVNFIPYLKEGANTIRIDTGVGGGGEGWIFLAISAWKPQCTMTLVNECSAYEAAK